MSPTKGENLRNYMMVGFLLLFLKNNHYLRNRVRQTFLTAIWRISRKRPFSKMFFWEKLNNQIFVNKLYLSRFQSRSQKWFISQELKTVKSFSRARYEEVRRCTADDTVTVVRSSVVTSVKCKMEGNILIVLFFFRNMGRKAHFCQISCILHYFFRYSRTVMEVVFSTEIDDRLILLINLKM